MKKTRRISGIIDIIVGSIAIVLSVCLLQEKERAYNLENQLFSATGKVQSLENIDCGVYHLYPEAGFRKIMRFSPFSGFTTMIERYNPDNLPPTHINCY